MRLHVRNHGGFAVALAAMALLLAGCMSPDSEQSVEGPDRLGVGDAPATARVDASGADREHAFTVVYEPSQLDVFALNFSVTVEPVGERAAVTLELIEPGTDRVLQTETLQATGGPLQKSFTFNSAGHEALTLVVRGEEGAADVTLEVDRADP